MILEAIMKYVIEMLKKVKNLFLNKNFIKFSLFGIINTLNTALFSQALVWLKVQKNMSAILGYILSLQIAFWLTSRYIFRVKPTGSRYARFILSYLPSFLVYILLHGILGNLRITQFSATMIAVLLSGPLTFVIVKIYAFEREGKGGKRDSIDE